MVAANKWYKKSVYYIDNVDASVSVDMMKEFIRSLSVRLVSCYAVKPRSRRGQAKNAHDEEEEAGEEDHEGSNPKTTAFRVCINSDDKDLLLDDEKWPAYVAICEWFFKNAIGTLWSLILLFRRVRREKRLRGKISATELHFFPNITTVIDNIIRKKGISYLITDWKLLLITVTTFYAS